MPENDVFPSLPDYPVSRRLLTGVIESAADSGRRFARLKRAPRLLHELEFRARSTREKSRLEEWYRRFDKSWFSLHDPVFGVHPDSGGFIERYFSVEFLGQPRFDLLAHEAWDMQVVLVDRVGSPLFQYPDPLAGHESVFLEESEGLALAGTWTTAAHANAHAGNEVSNPNTDPSHAFQWAYAGYGFRLWARRDTDLGILELLLDGASLGTLDLYAGSPTVAQPVFTKLDVPLGLHAVQVRATNTGNAGSSASTILADALEILI